MDNLFGGMGGLGGGLGGMGTTLIMNMLKSKFGITDEMIKKGGLDPMKLLEKLKGMDPKELEKFKEIADFASKKLGYSPEILSDMGIDPLTMMDKIKKMDPVKVKKFTEY